MKTRDTFEEAINGVTANKVRSGLTVLGIVIGIGSVIAMISVGQGAQNQINANIQSIGSNLLMVYPGSQSGVGEAVRSSRGSAQTLTEDDANAIASAETSLISAVAPEIDKSLQVVSGGQNTNTRVIGTTPSYPSVRDLNMEMGVFINQNQEDSLAKVAVIGPTTAGDLFGSSTTDPVGQKITINGVVFTVIGMPASKGGSGFNNQDDAIYIPMTTFRQYLGGKSVTGASYVSLINIKVTNQNAMTQVQNDITNLLLKRHNISDQSQADFSVLNQADVVQAASSVTGVFTMLLASIAGISLLVGGIGIMNMMLTTVTERTREIGLRKAIGSTRHMITLQFLIEAVVLTLLGGVIGIALGAGLSLAISYFAKITTSITISSIVLAVGVSAGIGIIFGYYPARRAASLNPIEALRYE